MNTTALGTLMLLVVLCLVFLFWSWRAGRRAGGEPGTASAGARVDPVCGMEISGVAAAHRETMGRTYYFCSEDCASEFDGDPPGHVRRDEERRRTATHHPRHGC